MEILKIKQMKTIIKIAGLLGLAGLLYVSGDVFLSPAVQHTERKDKQAEITGRFEQEYLMTRDPKTGLIPREALLDAYAYAEALRANKASDDLPIFWQERGPTNVGGRTRGIIFDANDPTNQTVWAGSVAGGLWRTNNIDAAAPNWVPINDLFQNLAVSTVAQDPTNPNLLYFGTGECFGNGDHVNGLGTWASADGGGNWAPMPPFDPANFPAAGTSGNTNNLTTSPCIVKLIVDNNGTLFAATRFIGLARFNASTQDWEPVLNSLQGLNDGSGNPVLGTASDFVTDVEIAANGDMYASFNQDQVYRSVNNGNNWTIASGGLPAANVRRIELACAPSNAAILYAAIGQPNPAPGGGGQTCLGIFQSTDFGANWSPATCPGNFGNQLWYDLILAVDPANPNRVWAGAVNMFVSNDAGGSWTEVGAGHDDHHNILFDPADPTQALFANDGGVYKSYDADAALPGFSDKNPNYNVTQFYAMALHPDEGSNVMTGGTQDNGTHRLSGAGLGASTQVIGADGGWCFIDQDNPDVRIASIQWGDFRVTNTGGPPYVTVFPDDGSNTRIFISPGGYDDDANILYVSDIPGQLGRVTDVGGANTATADAIPVLGTERISAFAASPATSNRMFMGTDGGRVFQVDNADQAGSTTWTFLNNPNVNGWVSCIAVDPTDEQHLLITYSNYNVNSIWETLDGGTNWESIEGNLPNMPVRWIMFWPGETDAAMIATDLGVWYAKDLDEGNTVWYPTNEFGLANCRVDMLMTRESDDLVAAATHGRGIYTTDYFTLLNNCEVSMDLPGNIQSGLYMAAEFISSDGTIPSGNTVIFQAGEYIELLPDFTAEAGSNFWGLIRECTPAGPVPPDVVTSGKEPESDPFQDLSEALEREGDTDVKPFTSPTRLQVVPNPTRETGEVRFTLDQAQEARVYLMDQHGQLVQMLDDGFLDQGLHQIPFYAEGLAAGVYLVVLQTQAGSTSERIVVVK